MSNRLKANMRSSARARAVARWMGISRHPLLFICRLLRHQRGIELAGKVPVSADEILDRLGALPISVWTYGFDHDSVRHIGPMAQDFAAAFGLGDSDKRIASVDADGINMAAIQALIRRVIRLEAELKQLRDSPRRPLESAPPEPLDHAKPDYKKVTR